MAWPVPKALEGAKSKKRPIFKVEPPGADAEKGPWAVAGPGLSLCLESRVAAIGEAGRLALAALVGGEGALEAWKHRGLIVARLGPELAAPGADREAHLEAAMEALKCRPQVVVLEEALGGSSASWAEAFHVLVRSEGLRNFGGAVVVCCAEETFAVRRVCSQRWFAPTGGGLVVQEDIAGRNIEVWEDALAAASSAAAAEDAPAGRRKGGKKQTGAGNGEIGALIEEAKALAEYCFEEDLLEVSREEGWTVTLLVEVAADGTKSLRGYLCFKMLPAPRCEMYIERLAVSKKTRGRGYARQLMRWASEEAVRMPREVCSAMTCSSLDTAVAFYQKLGFEIATCPEPPKSDDGDEDPQTWMQCRIDSLATAAVAAA